jgi:hypothetical protein
MGRKAADIGASRRTSAVADPDKMGRGSPSTGASISGPPCGTSARSVLDQSRWPVRTQLRWTACGIGAQNARTVIEPRPLPASVRFELAINQFARQDLQTELTRLDAASAKVMALLAELIGGPATAASKPARRARTMSDEGRERIRQSVQRRWDRVRAAQAASVATSAPLTPASVDEAPVARANVSTLPAGRRPTVSQRAGSRKR